MEPGELDTLRPALEALALCRSPELRERLLFEAVHGMGLAESLALWKRLEPSGTLVEVLARGPRDLLAGASQVEAVLAGELAPELPGRGLVVGPPGPDGRTELALAFGGLEGPDEALDFVEAILVVWSIVAHAERPAEAVDTLPSPLLDGALASEGNRLAHDLRNLLQCIVGNQDLASGAQGDELATVSALIERDVARAASLLRQALGQSAPGEGAAHAERIEAVCASEAALCQAAGVSLEVAIEPRARHGRARWSDLALERVLHNLIANARQAIAAARRGGAVHVRWRRTPFGFRLEVSDDGPGLPQDLEPGFGLTSVRTLVLAAGGGFAWRNLPTRGAEFAIDVPAAGNG